MAGMQTRFNKPIFLGIAASVSVFVGAICLISWIMIMGGFTELEQKFVQRNISRAQEVIEDRIDNIALNLSDWATWDDVCVFVQDRNEAFIQSNLTEKALDLINMSMMGFFNARGELVYFLHLHPGKKIDRLIPEELKPYFIPGKLLPKQMKEADLASGIVMPPGEPLMVVVMPILRSNGEGPVRGTMIMARYIDADEIKHFSDISQVGIEVKRADADSLPPEFQVARAMFSKGTQTYIAPLDSSTIAGYGILKDVFGKDALLLKVSMPREIARFGYRTLQHFVFTLIFIGLLFGGVVFFLLLREFSVRRQAEKHTLELKDRFEQVAEHVREIIWEVDAAGMYTYMNPVVKAILGYDREEMVGKKHLFDLHPEEGHEAIGQMVSEVFSRKGVLRDVETMAVSRDGRTVWLLTNGFPILDREGRLLGYRGSDYNITDRKLAEEEHLKYEQQLHQNQRLESLGVLAGGIAHDFNNFLSGIFGYISLARQGCNDEIITSYLSKALGSMERARGLTSQLLTFAKGGAPVRKICALAPFLRETAQFALSGSSVSCKFDIAKNLWPCSIDKNQMSQVIDNIIINAQQAMPLGGTIELTARNISRGEKEPPAPAADNFVEISIKDYGIGIPEALIPRIFDPFFSTKTKGHGLGLATCHSIIHQHGGWIEVASEPGKGSTFHIMLPASTESVLHATETSETVNKGSGTVLVMDDEKSVREVVGEMLQHLGYSVVLKENGRDAIDFWLAETEANRKLSHMIFDLTIPGGMGGKEAIGEIRKLDMEIPVFVASGYANDPIMANPMKYGFTASLRKPFSLDEFVAIQSKYLKKQS